jgi:hypothetical protein
VSDPARPESEGRAAFGELQSVIRNVTEQLAGFRRRALAAEAKLRDAEASAATAVAATESQRARVSALEAALAESRKDAGRSAALEGELASARREAARVQELERALAEATATAEAMAQAASSVPDADIRAPAGVGGDDALAAENAALRERLTEAVERTRLIAERVRFLRQQLTNGEGK